MSDGKGTIVKFVLRTAAVLLAGIIISAAYLGNVGTLSWFTSSGTGTVKVTAAETEDILELFELVYHCDNPRKENPIALRIRKAPGLGYDPVIFFSIEGEIEDYLINVNPIRLESSGTYVIPLEISCSMGQWTNIMETPGIIKGKLVIKYLNEYISEELDLSYTSLYIFWNRFFNYAGKREIVIEEPTGRLRKASVYGSSIDDGDIDEQLMRKYVYRSMVHFAEQIEWEEAEIDEDNLSSGSVIKLSSDQDVLMDIIVPGLKDILRKLVGTIDSLKAELAEKVTQLTALDGKLTDLQSRYDQLLQENEELREQISRMSAAQPLAVPGVKSTPPLPAAGGDNGGSTGEGDTGTGDTAESDAEEGNTGEGDSGAGDTGEGGNGEGNTNEGNAGEDNSGGSNTGTGDIDGKPSDSEDGTEGDSGGEGDFGENSDTSDEGNNDSSGGEGDTDEGGTDEGDTDGGGTDEGNADEDGTGEGDTVESDSGGGDTSAGDTGDGTSDSEDGTEGDSGGEGDSGVSEGGSEHNSDVSNEESNDVSGGEGEDTGDSGQQSE